MGANGWSKNGLEGGKMGEYLSGNQQADFANGVSLMLLLERATKSVDVAPEDQRMDSIEQLLRDKEDWLVGEYGMHIIRGSVDGDQPRWVDPDDIKKAGERFLRWQERVMSESETGELVNKGRAGKREVVTV